MSDVQELRSGLLAHVVKRMRRAIEEARTRGGMRVGPSQVHVDASELEQVLNVLEKARDAAQTS